MRQPDSTDGQGYDVLVIGGGPGGAIAAMELARRKFRVAVLEKTTFPRFHIGESLVPHTYALLKDLGLEQAVRGIPHMKKWGAEFAMGDCAPDATSRFTFDTGYIPGGMTLNVERAPFDAMLLREAADAGAEVRQGVGVRKVLRLADGDIAVETDGGEQVAARYVLDASGQSTVVARHLGTKQPLDDPCFQKVAHFAHFEGVKRLAGDEEGHPAIVMCEEGWFWIINLDEKRTSVGLVMDVAAAKSTGVPAERLLAWAVQRCPLMRDRMREATGPDRNQVIANFSYRCRPFAGPGYYLVGDAAAFIDPIFSTGVFVATIGALKAADAVGEVLRGHVTPEAARHEYVRHMEGGTAVFFKLIRQYYDHSFRELFLKGTGPYQMHRAVLAALAGHVFPRPAWPVRWRLALFDFHVWLNRFVPLVGRRTEYSLLRGNAEPEGAAAPMTAAGALAASTK